MLFGLQGGDFVRTIANQLVSNAQKRAYPGGVAACGELKREGSHAAALLFGNANEKELAPVYYDASRTFQDCSLFTK